MYLLNNYQQFGEWLSTDLGKYVLSEEQQQFRQLCTENTIENILIIGYPEFGLDLNVIEDRIVRFDQFILMPVSIVLKNSEFSKLSPTYITAAYDKLPISENLIDIVYLPHSLEIFPDPVAILTEAYRVLKPEGRIIISGFSLFSIWGGYKFLAKKFPIAPWVVKLYDQQQIFNWLKLLNFSKFTHSYCCYNLCIKKPSKWLLKILATVFKFLPLIPGNVYTIVAVKKVIKLTVILDKTLDQILDHDSLVKTTARN